LVFGNVVIPSNGSKDVTVFPSGSVIGNIDGDNGQRRGSHEITGSPNEQFKVTITNNSSTAQYVSLARLYAEVGGLSCNGESECGFTGLVMSGNGEGGTLLIGATMRVQSSAEPGRYESGQLSYTVTTEYE
jgi:carbohydrate-selective porin OprB